MNERFNPVSIKDGIQALITPGELYELRIPHWEFHGGTAAGFFDDPGKLAKALAGCSGHAPGIYLTLNPVDPQYGGNKNVMCKDVKNSTADSWITRREWLFIDIDPERPSKTCATDLGKVKAKEVADSVLAYLGQRGWPGCYLIDSGNGFQLRHKISLPNDEESRGLVKDCLHALSSMFSTPEAKIDLIVYNAARIARFPGTLNAKGENTTERPWRISKLIGREGLAEVAPVPIEKLKELAALAPKPERAERQAENHGSGTGDELGKILAQWARICPDFEFQSAHIGGEVNGPGYWVRCPGTITKWPDGTSHGGGFGGLDASSVVFVRDGLFCFSCFHSSCSVEAGAERKKTWGDFRNYYDKVARDKLGVEEVETAGWEIVKQGPGNALACVPACIPAPLPSSQASAELMEVQDYSEDITCTDVANGMRLARFCGNDLAFVEESKCWHAWDGRKWAEDREKIRVNRMAEEVAKSIFAEADTYEENKRQSVRKWAYRSCFHSNLEAMVSRAKNQGMIAKSIRDFDQDPYLFNCASGIINLRTGELMPHDRKRLMMKMSPVNYDRNAECPAWDKFLARIQREDHEMIGFLQRLAGYSMCGTSEEQAVHFLYGGGRNGKGVFLLALQRILGDYTTTVPFTTFLEGARHDASGPNEAIAGMAGKRLVVAQESNPTGRFNEGLIKTLTGGGRQKASFKYGHEFEFDPLFTLILAANHKPRVIDQTEAIKSRIKLIPFTVQIPEAARDLKLIDKLWAEREGILAWCVRGAVEWAKDGLKYPSQVNDASREYSADQDVVGQWLAECTEEGPHEFPAGLAYDSFKRFAEENNYFVLDSREFKNTLEQKGFQHKKGMRGR